MIIPSGIQLPEGESLEVQEEVEGMFSIPNAYKGEYQEFFKGKLTPIRVMAAAAGSVTTINGDESSTEILRVRPSDTKH